MFDILNTSFEKIVSNIGIIGYKEEDIKNRGINSDKILPLNCLYIYPNKKQSWLNSFTFQMMFPDDNHKIPCPKFFALTLTNEKGTRSYLYCLKFSEKYDLSYDKDKNKEIDIPIVIFIKSEKEDLESFKQLLNLVNFIIVNDDIEKNCESNYDKINDYKKVQLMNLFYFLFSLPYTTPHSLVKLKLDKEFKNSPFESIDFYFSSNCEIPSNKNDTDINILFLLLDQSIIIKVLFSILIEKRLVFRASQVYLLHIIIPSFLKLIFPFKWLHRCITVLPKEKLNLFEAPGPFIFGVLSTSISLDDLMSKYPGIIIIDCDTNEIYGDSHLEPFNPPKNNILLNQSKNRNNKKENEGIIINNGNSLTQGKNAFNISGSYLYKYENEKNSKKNKFIFDKNKNNIIIDTKNSQLLIDKTIIFMDTNEWKWLRKNIQLVRNPEIFYLDNLSKKKKNPINSVFLSEEEDENIILPNKSFSYNIQNIFMKFILNKLSFTESEFMLEFKNTNLYLNYNESNKYQNNSGKKIVENILELKDQQRNIDNCFNIEYLLPKLDTSLLLNKLEEKLKDDELNKNNENNNYIKIKNIFDNYKKISSEYNIDNDFYNNEIVNENVKGELKYTEERKSDIKRISRITKVYKKGHEHNKTSVLQESFSGSNKFSLFGIDNSIKGVFKFYKEKGFLEFIHSFELIMDEEKLNIDEEIYENKIYHQILNIILGNINIFKNSNNETNETNEIINSNNDTNNNKNEINRYNIKKLHKENNNKKSMEIIMENAPEEEENDLNEGRGTVIQKNIGEEYDFTDNIMNDINEYHQSIIPKEEPIINFSNFNESKEKEFNDKSEDVDDNINYKMQYYLFIIIIIQEIIKKKEKLDDLINTIKKQKNEKITINSFLLKLYRLAFKYSGTKHRDFPYFSYYTFLSKLDLEELKKLNEDFNNLTNTEIELFEIFGKVNLEKEKELKRKEKKLKNKSERNKNIDIKSQKINEEEFKKIMGSDLINIDNSKEFNKSNIYIINIEKEFEINKNENVDLNLINIIAKELDNLILKIKDIKTKSVQDIIEEMNKNIVENKNNNSNIIDLIGQLKYVNTKKINLLKPRMCFWLNCFNYLIIFTLFYKKWNINTEEDWKCFLNNVKYKIDEDIFSFNDIQYIIYQKNLFIDNNYKISENIKNYRIHKAEDAKIIEKKLPLLYNPFMIYLPIKGFNKTIIYEENQFEIQMKQRISNFFQKFLRIDYDKNIHYHQLLIEHYPNFMNKDIKKFQPYLIPTIYNFIKDKKYNSTIQKNLDWKLDFEAFLEDLN